MFTMKITKRIHPIYKEWLGADKKFQQIIGKWQYLYENNKGMISLVKFKNYFLDGQDWFEICCVSEDQLFEDVERYKTRKEAVSVIYKYLGEKNKGDTS